MKADKVAHDDVSTMTKATRENLWQLPQIKSSFIFWN